MLFTDQSLADDSESDVPESREQDVTPKRDVAEDNGGPQETTKETVNETPRRDPDLPVITLKRKRPHMKAPPKKPNKAEKLEATLEKTMSSFLKYQREAEERFEDREEKRRREDREAAEREREKERQHELRLFSMLSGHMNSPHQTPAMAPPQQRSGPMNNTASLTPQPSTSNMTPQHTFGSFRDMMSDFNDEYDQNLEMSYTNL